MRKITILGDDAVDVVKSIKEGDTTVELQGDTAASRLDALAAVLLRGRDLGCYRKLKW